MARETDGLARMPAKKPAILTLIAVRALVVDDDEDVLALHTIALERAGADVVAVTGGEAALDALTGGAFDVVICDIDMPGIDGMRMIRTARSLDHGLARVPAIAVTANIEPVTRAHAVASGFDDFAAKPVTGVALVALVASVLRLHERSADDSGVPV